MRTGKVSPEARARRFMERLTQYGNLNAGKLVAYFCMEFGLPRVPIYSGGLGMLAGDTLRSAAHLNDPLVGVGILYRGGFYKQEIAGGVQKDPPQPQEWEPEKHPDLFDLGRVMDEPVEIVIGGSKLSLRRWGYEAPGRGDNFAPLLLLDSLGYPNPAHLQEITRGLYVSGEEERIRQEIVLGVGGMRMLESCGLPVSYYHLNEGHAAFAPLEFLRRVGTSCRELTEQQVEAALRSFSFTTHTPEAAGHDRFFKAHVESAFYDPANPFLREAALRYGVDPRDPQSVNMTYLALQLSGARNAVSILHAKVSEGMFPGFAPILPITNGVDHSTWVSEAIGTFNDKHCPAWRENPERLIEMKAKSADPDFREELWQAHMEAKRKLFKRVRDCTGTALDENVLTFGFARRFAGYKRADLIFKNIKALIRIAREKGKMQLIFAGKPHPNDGIGKQILARVLKWGARIAKLSEGRIKFVFLEDYNMDSAKDLVAGVDVWLNNPKRPREASGTSGMKAAANYVPQLSTPDGWWVERRGGGWTINEGKELEGTEADPDIYIRDAEDLYRLLEIVMDKYYHRESDPAFVDCMIEAGTQNGSYFNTHRMVREYRQKVWSPERFVGAAPQFDREPAESPQGKLIRLSGIVFNMARAGSQEQVEEMVAKGMAGNLKKCFRITRYHVHNESACIHRRWVSGRNGEVVFEENRDNFGKTGFAHWKKIDDFKGEVMADLLRDRENQYVPDPKSDPRCYREGHLVSENPFIFIPEIVNDELVGAYKVDFRPGVSWEKAFEKEFLEELFRYVGISKTAILKKDLARDLEGFNDRNSLINWALTLMTSGGFVDMPRYAVETNRVAYFENTPEGLVGRLGIGDVDRGGHDRTLVDLQKHLYSAGVEKFLRGFDQSQSALARRVAGQDLGPNPVPGPIYFDHGMPTYDQRQFADFDARAMSALKGKIEDLFQTDGRKIEQYLLLPVKGEKGRVLGIIYVDNAFSYRPLSIDKYQSMVCVLGNILSRL